LECPIPEIHNTNCELRTASLKVAFMKDVVMNLLTDALAGLDSGRALIFVLIKIARPFRFTFLAIK
jgi:hypothetical protein